jgi:hypothetical protein
LFHLQLLNHHHHHHHHHHLKEEVELEVDLLEDQEVVVKVDHQADLRVAEALEEEEVEVALVVDQGQVVKAEQVQVVQKHQEKLLLQVRKEQEDQKQGAILGLK